MSNIRPICCGKKRKAAQIYWTEGYDGGVYRCKRGKGCNGTRPKHSSNTPVMRCLHPHPINGATADGYELYCPDCKKYI